MIISPTKAVVERAARRQQWWYAPPYAAAIIAACMVPLLRGDTRVWLWCIALVLGAGFVSPQYAMLTGRVQALSGFLFGLLGPALLWMTTSLLVALCFGL